MLKNFTDRHIGLSENDTEAILAKLNVTSIDQLIEQTIPDHIRYKANNGQLNLPEGTTEERALAELQSKLEQNKISKPMIGQGYYNCYLPPVIQRNLFENPAWYTSYTPYQAEISQGRLELLFHFQTLVSELTQLPVANASLLDEATAINEAVGIALRHHRHKRKQVVVMNELHPQSLSVLNGRMEHLGCEVVQYNKAQGGEAVIGSETLAIVIQTPDTYGNIADFSAEIALAKQHKALTILCCDPMAMLMMSSPASMGADIACGSMQRYGVPLGNGGPHAAFLAVTQQLTRLLPGRLIGESIDSHNRVAYRLALQTREQHIRRDKATSNICTAQALLANISTAYAIWHGPKGLNDIARRIHQLCCQFNEAIGQSSDYQQCNQKFFDTLHIRNIRTDKASQLIEQAEQQGYLLRQIDGQHLVISFDETTTQKDVIQLCNIFNITPPNSSVSSQLSLRSGSLLTQPVFHEHHSETAMMRYLIKLANKDLALDKAMIPLGSCTMKLNAASEMMPVSWSSISQIHPYAPSSHQKGYQLMIDDLDQWLREITGFAKISFQPNSGSQGEYAGLIAIKKYHQQNAQGQRNVCLIPESAHGTNPASAQIAGFKIVVIKCDKQGNIDLDDLVQQAQKHQQNLAALMITYPSTHGVFESSIKEICTVIHDNGGQVYFDGANLNALVGLVIPANLGADVCHMNLHKTFCIPHGGGGPGVGPIGVAEHLVPFLPGSFADDQHMVSAAPNGSASILPITWMYIRLLGAEGLKQASQFAILNANYIATSLEPAFKVLYKGDQGRVAHECIVDPRAFKSSAEISVDDIAKRLIDYGFHAPTMSWPVMGTLMIEPTESEPKLEMDRFINAMLSIREEIKQVEQGQWQVDDNPLINSPHTSEELLSEQWEHCYSRTTAATDSVPLNEKYWAPVSRVDNLYGDRNLVCSCPPVDSYK